LRYAGKLGGTYPGNSDPMLSYKIDKLLAETDAVFLKTINAFILPMHPGFKNKDVHFTSFITGDFHVELAKLDDLLAKSNGKYLFGDQLTVADCSIGSHMLKIAHNPIYDNSLILREIVDQYPRVKAWFDLIVSEFGHLLDETKAPC
jgi:glutathione S-transferase